MSDHRTSRQIAATWDLSDITSNLAPFITRLSKNKKERNVALLITIKPLFNSSTSYLSKIPFNKDFPSPSPYPLNVAVFTGASIPKFSCVFILTKSNAQDTCRSRRYINSRNIRRCVVHQLLLRTCQRKIIRPVALFQNLAFETFQKLPIFNSSKSKINLLYTLYLPTYLPTYLPISLSISISIRPSVCLSVYLYTHIYTHTYIYIYIYTRNRIYTLPIQGAYLKQNGVLPLFTLRIIFTH
jgi:hypothetical protein